MFFLNKQFCSYYTYSGRIFQTGFFSRKKFLNLNKLPSLQGDLKITLGLGNCIFFSIKHLKRAFELKEDLLYRTAQTQL